MYLVSPAKLLPFLILPIIAVFSLALLLPPGEFEDSALLKPMLRDALAEFDTPTGKVNANLIGYECFPEGAGIYAMYCKNTGEAIRRKVIALVWGIVTPQ